MPVPVTILRKFSRRNLSLMLCARDPRDPRESKLMAPAHHARVSPPRLAQLPALMDLQTTRHDDDAHDGYAHLCPISLPRHAGDISDSKYALLLLAVQRVLHAAYCGPGIPEPTTVTSRCRTVAA